MEIIKLTTPLTESSFSFIFLKGLLIIGKTFFSCFSDFCQMFDKKKINKINKCPLQLLLLTLLSNCLIINFTYWYTVYEIVHSEKCVIRM